MLNRSISTRSPDNVIDFLQLPKEKRKSQVSLKDALLSVAATHLATSVSTIDVVEQRPQTPTTPNPLPSLRSTVFDELTPLRSTPSLHSQRSPPFHSPSLTRPVPVAPVPGSVSIDSPSGDQLMKSHSIGRLVASVSGSFVEIERAESPGMQLNDHQQRTGDEMRSSRCALALVGGGASGTASQRSLYGGVDLRATASVKGSRTHLVQAADEEPTRNGAIVRDSSQYSIGLQSTSRSPSQNRSRASTNCGELEVHILFIFIFIFILIYIFLNNDIQSRSSNFTFIKFKIFT